ncbi:MULTISPECIES: NAD(P)H-quinone oxidoreductase [Corynebacterium]|jgi:putative PIG3 family NAD(P)H quinone oxidoreductase|uniref:NAD(P)H-quinone oxidoreductase n=1 Tax=Corynebacterium TaxID=1716 RepID=UPI000836FB3D|nr:MULTISPECIES: NAD(P)H-quinone oxidoreductase [Corynebacterium]MCI1256939.1 NAD(P)H-quinone oxidoreductase [Corynebacterium provencense]
MKAIIQKDPDDPTSLTWSDSPTPVPGDNEVLVKVTAAGVNRADTLQAQGHYPPPPGVTDIIGLEVAGVIEDANGCVRPDGTPWASGDRVGALLSGGGYAEYVTVPAGQLLPVPAGFSLTDTASIVEVACTVWSNLMMTAHLHKGDLLLVHGGGGGVGLFAVQVAKALGARVAVTAGSTAKLDVCRSYGAELLINYRDEDFTSVIREAGGADVILDIIGAKYLDRNVSALASDGHLVIIGMQGGVRGELNIGRLLNRRGTISATGLRYRDTDDKARIVRATVDNVWPMLADGTVRHHVDRVIPVRDAAAAHAALLAGEVTGKIVLSVSD